MDFYASVDALDVDRAHLVVEGELDAFTALELCRRLDETLATGFVHLTVDAARLTFIDAAGVAAFVRLRNAATRLGGTVSFVAASPSFRRVCGAVGLTQAFRLQSLSEHVEYDMA